MAVPAARRSPRVSSKIAATWRRLKKDVNLNGTNRTNPLESTKVSGNKPKNGAIQTQKASRKYAKRLELSEKRAQNGAILARFLPTLTRPWISRYLLLSEAASDAITNPANNYLWTLRGLAHMLQEPTPWALFSHVGGRLPEGVRSKLRRGRKLLVNAVPSC
jgi:hypothetical protein